MAQKRTRNKKWLYGIAGLVVLVGLGVAGFLIWQGNNGEQRSDDSEVVSEDEKETKSEESVETGELASTGVEKEKVVQYDGEDPNEAEELSGVVTYAGVNGGSLMIRVSIDQYLMDGKCELTLVQSGATIYSSIANIVGDVTASTCEGFDVPVTELGGGNTQINIKLSAGEKGGSIHGEVEL